MKTEDEMIPLEEAALSADLAPETLRKAAQKGSLTARKKGRNWFTTEGDLQRWLNDRDAHKPGPKRRKLMLDK